jgi:hypothetical protein
MQCDGTSRQAHVALAPAVVDTGSPSAIPWSASDSSHVLAAIRIAFDAASPRSVFLKKTHAEAGLLVSRKSPLGGAAGEALSQQLGRSPDLLFGDVFAGVGMPGRVTILDLVPGEQIVFSFDSLADADRRIVQDVCFGAAASGAEHARCIQDTSRRVARELEVQFEEEKRGWCESTRESRQNQLIRMFITSVRQARNGGDRLATALARFIDLNPDLVIASTEQSSQLCSDVHFGIDVTRLSEMFQIPGTGQSGTSASKQRMSYLLNEGVVITRTTQFEFELPMPSAVSADWERHMREAEAECQVSPPSGDRVSPGAI